MANGTRTLSLAIGFVVALAVGWFIGHSQPSPQPQPTPQPQTTPVPTASPVATTECPPADHQVIEVGPTADVVSKKDAAISLSKDHRVFWISKAATKLKITFRKGDFPTEAHGEPPFENGPNGVDQVITCTAGGVCNPGHANKKLKNLLPASGCFSYKYYQKLGEDEKDARIIIEK